MGRSTGGAVVKVPMLTVYDDYEPIPPATPTKAGFYLLAQEGEDPQIVELVVDGDHRMA